MVGCWPTIKPGTIAGYEKGGDKIAAVSSGHFFG